MRRAALAAVLPLTLLAACGGHVRPYPNWHASHQIEERWVANFCKIADTHVTRDQAIRLMGQPTKEYPDPYNHQLRWVSGGYDFTIQVDEGTKHVMWADTDPSVLPMNDQAKLSCAASDGGGVTLKHS